ncbi:MAG: Gfo/Idh/MocA family oxidoreductase [Pirellulales bacterium]
MNPGSYFQFVLVYLSQGLLYYLFGRYVILPNLPMFPDEGQILLLTVAFSALANTQMTFLIAGHFVVDEDRQMFQSYGRWLTVVAPHYFRYWLTQFIGWMAWLPVASLIHWGLRSAARHPRVAAARRFDRDDHFVDDRYGVIRRFIRQLLRHFTGGLFRTHATLGRRSDGRRRLSCGASGHHVFALSRPVRGPFTMRALRRAFGRKRGSFVPRLEVHAMRPIRIAIIGAGKVSDYHHVPAIRLDPRCELVAACDTSAALLETKKSEWNVAKISTDPLAVCADPDVDAVIIATPNFTHLDIALAAAKHGKHIMCEKPLGLNAGEVERMYRAVPTTAWSI